MGVCLVATMNVMLSWNSDFIIALYLILKQNRNESAASQGCRIHVVTSRPSKGRLSSVGSTVSEPCGLLTLYLTYSAPECRHLNKQNVFP